MKRGNLLWTGSRMMLAEHRQLLNERLERLETDDTVFWTDEQQLEEWQEIWEQALRYNYAVSITYKDKAKRNVIGKVTNYTPLAGTIYLQLNSGEQIKIPIKQIIDLKLG